MKNLFSTWEKIGCFFYPAFKFYHRLYRDVVAREIGMAGISRESIVLNIGCGAIPFTAVHLIEMTGARVIAMDKDEDAIIKARNCLNKYTLDPGGKIELQVGDGTETIPAKFTAAIVALQVYNKGLVLERLMKTGTAGASLVFRRPVPAYTEEYGDLPAGRKPDCQVFHSMKTFHQSCLFRVPGNIDTLDRTRSSAEFI